MPLLGLLYTLAILSERLVMDTFLSNRITKWVSLVLIFAFVGLYIWARFTNIAQNIRDVLVAAMCVMFLFNAVRIGVTKGRHFDPAETGR